jgi:hypothetical protein
MSRIKASVIGLGILSDAANNFLQHPLESNESGNAAKLVDCYCHLVSRLTQFIE